LTPSICNKAPSLGISLVLSTSLLAVACFDVERVALTSPRIYGIDDFEGADSGPSSNEFAVWVCHAWQADAPPPTCLVTSPGFNSNHAESLRFELPASTDPMKPNGVGLRVFLGAGTLDLSSWKALRFAAKLEPIEPASSEGTVWIRLPCSTVPHSGASPDGGYNVEYAVHVPRQWSSFRAPLAKFVQPAFQNFALDRAECIARVDAVSFEVGFLDGEPGTLTIDDVYLE
jgi:hypothetical protein